MYGICTMNVHRVVGVRKGWGKVKKLLRTLGLLLCNGNRTEWNPIWSVISIH